METLYGISNWKLTIRRAEDHIEILRGITCDTHAVLPDELFGLPVTVLGDHALAPTARPIAGEEVRVVSGREGEWSNRDLQELTLPAGLTAVHNYAFYGCRSLHTLRLHDNVNHWGVDCLMNCHRLSNLHLTRTGEVQGEALAYICGAIHEELDVVLYGTDGTETRLVFPDYMEDYEENFPNHSFDYHIMGGGYAYHHTFPKKQLILRTYDEHWPQYLRKEHEDETALRLAYTRLRWPTGLEPFAEQQYVDFLAANAHDAILWQLSLRDAAGLRLLLDRLNPDESIISAACARARAEGNTEGLALLLERQRRNQPKGLDRDFDL
ncbi:MAG: leucine-rich repeat protein [Clostridia bacterium]|nr:leucine-rich repeat protein [Clostridia bacterium]